MNGNKYYHSEPGHKTTSTHDNGRIYGIGEKRDIASFGDGIDSTEFDIQPAWKLYQTSYRAQCTHLSVKLA